MEEKKYISISKALSDSNRMKIFKMLREQDMCAFEILKHLECSQPTLSYHMKLLTDSGIVNGRKQGLWMHYSVDNDVLKEYSNYFMSEPAKSAEVKTEA